MTRWDDLPLQRRPADVAAQLRRTRNGMLVQAGRVRRAAEVEAAHCVREAALIDAELSRMGFEPGPGTFEAVPDDGGAA